MMMMMMMKVLLDPRSRPQNLSVLNVGAALINTKFNQEIQSENVTRKMTISLTLNLGPEIVVCQTRLKLLTSLITS